MQSLAVVFHRVGVALCLTAFALMFVSANLAGADPLVAMVRAVAGTTALAVVFVGVCRVTLSVFGVEKLVPSEIPADEPEA